MTQRRRFHPARICSSPAQARREAEIARFLAARGWEGALSRPLAGDASFRRYRRIGKGGRHAVLMDAPPPKENVRPFVALAGHLKGLGLSAPDVLAVDAERGFLVLEDLGDLTYTRLLGGEGPGEEALYALAVDVLIHLHRISPARAIPKDLPLYDDDRLLEEAYLLTDWYMPAVLGEGKDPRARTEYGRAWRPLFQRLRALPPVLVLRDYHVDNLVWLPQRSGVAACGLLDFQDAVAGPAAYDLMSLLEDARRDIPYSLIEAMKARYFAAFASLARPGPERDAFETAFAILAAQRHAKVIGIFTRLCVRDGKPDYLMHVPRVWRLLTRAVGHAALAPVRAWLHENVPPGKRGVPPCQPRAN